MLDKKDIPKKKPGRTKIDNRERTNSFSQRAAEDRLKVIKKKCPFCNHHKAFQTPTKTKCCRCKK